MTMAHIYQTLAKDVLGLRTNVPDLKWSFGITAPHASEADYAKCPVKIDFFVEDFFEEGRPLVGKDGGRGKYHYFSGNPHADALAYRRTFLFNKELQLCADGIAAGVPRLRVNRTYYRWVRHRFMNLHSPGYLLTDIAAYSLLHHGFAPIHCSSFTIGDAAIVVFAPPNTGKTLTTMQACLEHGATYIAEDLAITDGSQIHGVPWTSTFRYYGDVDVRRWSRFVQGMTSRIPALELFNTVRPRPITDYVGHGDALASGKRATHVVILERGSANRVQRVDATSATRKIVNLNRYEFNFLKSPLLVAYEYFNPSASLDAAREAEVALLTQLTESADEVWLVEARSAAEYVHLILDSLRPEASRRRRGAAPEPPALVA